MTGPEVLAAMHKHATGRHSKGSMMISGADVKALVDYLFLPIRPVGEVEAYLQSQMIDKAVDGYIRGLRERYCINKENAPGL